MATKTVKGTVQNWHMGNGKEKKYLTAEIKYGSARTLLRADVYNVENSLGEQRPKDQTQVRKLRNAIENGNYTPASFAASVKDNHEVRFEKNQAVIEVDEQEPLALINGFQRFSALESLRDKGGVTQKLIDNLPITCIVHLNAASRKIDFLNSNKNKPINKTHMLNLMVDSKAIEKGDPALVENARNIARLLQAEVNSHVYNQIGMSGYSKAAINLSSLTSSHASEQASSLYGLAKVAREYEKDNDWAVQRVVDAWQILQDATPELLETGKVLAPPPNGKVLGASLIVGLSVLLAYRQKLLEQDKPTDNDIELFVTAARAVFDISDEVTIKEKRSLLGDFAELFFADLAEREDTPVGYHDGLPIPLSRVFSGPSYGRESLPKEKAPKKGRGRPKKVKEAAPAVPDKDGEVESSESPSDTDEEFEIDTDIF